MVKPYLAVFAALLTFISCSKEPQGGNPDGICVVRFSAPGSPDLTPSVTRAAVPLPQGATVRVGAYRRSAGSGSPDPVQDTWMAANTYEARSGGALVPALTGDDGNTVPGTADDMSLHSGAYDFYAYSPALKVEADNYTVKGITHYTDFMGAVIPAQAVSRSAPNVSLTFGHKCSKVRFNVKTTAEMENASLSADQVILYKMAVSPADYALGGDITPSAGDQTSVCTLSRIEAAGDHKSTSVWDILLPKSSGAFDGRFYLKVNGRDYMLKADDIASASGGMSFAQGTQYIFSAVVRQGSVSLVLDVASWDAVSGNIDAGEGGGAGSGSWEPGGEAGGGAGGNHGIEIGRWENVDWEGSVGGNPDPVTGAVEVGSWVPAEVIVDAGGAHVADIDAWVKKTLAALAGGNHGGNVGDWGENEFDTGLGLEVSAPANCYMVAPDDIVAFDARVQGNGGAGAVAMVPKSVQVLWQEGDGIAPLIEQVTFADGIVKVKSNIRRQLGNAVIAAYSGEGCTGNILWSWQIWVTDYNPDGSKSYGLGLNSKASVTGGEVHRYGQKYELANGNKVIMDRNLGATKAYYAAPAAGDATADQSFGMFYQWGRKDPFPRAQGSSINENIAAIVTIYGSDGTTVLPEEVTGHKKVNITTGGVMNGGISLAYSIKNPLTLICNAATPFDWYTDAAVNQNNGLWGDGVSKSIYDPCPKGWRIAPDGTWSDFTRTANTDDPNLGTFPYYSEGVVGETYDGRTSCKATCGRLYKVSASETGTPLAWYPAAGTRDNGEGGLWGVGYYGYSWSSMVRDISGVFLHFDTTWLNPSNGNNRGQGLQVRCIQE